MRIIVRRPHAYRFREQHEQAPIPGFVVLDHDGTFVGGVPLPSAHAVAKVVELLRR